MTIQTMSNSTSLSLAEIKIFLGSSSKIQFKSKSKKERNEWVQKVLMHHKYQFCPRTEKSLIRRYIKTLTGLSKSQLTRLIKEYRTRGTLKAKEYQRHKFPKIYNFEEIALLANIDNAHNCLSGPATKKIIKEEYEVFGYDKYEKLKDLSVSHLYRLRTTKRYREKVKVFSKTKATKTPIGERKKPEPQGRPGYLCVDTVHQGDKMGEKGAYHVNIVDMATQFEFVGSVEAISERYMKDILKELLCKFPFVLKEFHADNGSEYINKVVAKLLNKLLIKLTKSRPRHSNDNPLVETKNGAVIRKHMGYVHIPRGQAKIVNKFYQDWFNDYLNYHRPCAFPKIEIDKKGKEKRTYPHENYMMPYDKFKSLNKATQYLKSGITFAQLDEIAYAMSHTDYAIQMNKAKEKMLKEIFTNPKLSNKDNQTQLP